MTTFTLTVCDVCGSRDTLPKTDAGMQAEGMAAVLFLMDDSSRKEADVCEQCRAALEEAMDARIRIVADRDMAVGA